MSLKAKVQWLVESAKKPHPLYNNHEQDSIRKYIDGWSQDFNDYLRGKGGSTNKLTESIEGINSALDKTKNHNGFLTHRTIRSNTKTRYKVGNKYIHYGYMSTTKDPSILSSQKLHDHLGEDKLDIHMHLKVPKNHPYIDAEDISPKEYKYQKEMILPHKTRFQVTKIEKKGNVKHVHGNVLPYEGDDHD